MPENMELKTPNLKNKRSQIDLSNNNLLFLTSYTTDGVRYSSIVFDTCTIILSEAQMKRIDGSDEYE